MSQDVVADGLNMIRNAKKARKETLLIGRISNLLIEVLKIMKEKGAIKKYKINSKDKTLEVLTHFSLINSKILLSSVSIPSIVGFIADSIPEKMLSRNFIFSGLSYLYLI